MTRQQTLTDPAPAGQATAAPEDRVLQVGWKYDPARDRLGPASVVYTLYRDAPARLGAIVSYIQIARRDPCGATALSQR
jgi:hypothetical protein